MPNGGMKLCCQLCKWAEKATIHDLKHEGMCQRHRINVWLLDTFCRDLDFEQLQNVSDFIQSLNLNTVYIWVEVAYQDPRAPGLPLYHHDLVALARVEEYATWNAQQILEAHRNANEQFRDEFIRKYTQPKPDDE